MNEAAIGIVILVALSIICAIASHALIRRQIIASAVAAPIASLIFQIANTVHLGGVDPFAPIAFVVGTFWAFLIACLVGLPFWVYRAKDRA